MEESCMLFHRVAGSTGSCGILGRKGIFGKDGTVLPFSFTFRSVLYRKVSLIYLRWRVTNALSRARRFNALVLIIMWLSSIADPSTN